MMKKDFIHMGIAVLVGGFLGWLIMFFGFQIYNNNQSLNAVDNFQIDEENLTQLSGQKNVIKNENELIVQALITPHHLVAEELIEDIFQKVAEENSVTNIDRIILISPNHFNAGGGNFIISDQDLQLENSLVKVDKNLTELLKSKKLAYVQNDIFAAEHGIIAPLTFVDKYFSGIPVLPLLIRDKTPENEIDRLAEFLTSNEIGGNNLFILSSDFSHELDKNISHFHDQMAIDVIENFDFLEIFNLETDCVGGLRLIMKIAEENNYKNFQLLANSNSSEIYNEFFIGENTSYVTGEFLKSAEIDLINKSTQQNQRPINLLFGGDVMLDRSIRSTILKFGVPHLTEKMQRLFWAQDLNIINLEGPITDNQSISNVPVSNSNHFRFTFDKKQTEEFFDFNRVDVISAGNNHILNFGQDGELETRNFLEKSNVAYFGMPNMQENNSVIKEIKGRKIAFVAYNYSGGLSQSEVVSEIQKMKTQNDLVIVFSHWGNEYRLQEGTQQKDLAYKFIDAGADLIIGAHPHVVQPIEIYKEKAIFYSLGNFIFDQYFSEDVKERLLVGLSIDSENNFNFVLIPVYTNNNGQLELMNLERRKKFLERIAEDSTVNEEIKNSILNGVFK